MAETPEAVLELTDAHRQAAELAADNRRKFEAFIAQGVDKARLVSGDGNRTELLAAGVVDLMLLELVTGKVRPKSAKEAMDVATQAHTLMRRERGEPDSKVVIRTPEQRQQAIQKVEGLRMEAERRRALTSGEPEPDPIEDAVLVDEDLAAGMAASEPIPRSTGTGRALSTLRAERPATGHGG